MHDRSTVEGVAVLAPGKSTSTWTARASATLRGKGRNAGLIGAIVALFLWTGAHNANFLTLENLRVLGLQMAFFAIVGVGMTFLLITGNVDLSVGANYALTAILSAQLSIHLPVWLAMVCAILVGGVVGLVNGILVWNVRISPLIITLGSMTLLDGLNLVITHGYAVTGEPTGYTAWGNAAPLGIPMPIVVFLMCALAGTVFLATTKQGRHIYAVGGSHAASRAAGLDVRLIVIATFAFTGLLCGLAGTLAGSEYGAPDPTYGNDVMLSVITGVILGGVSFAGGEGGVIGAMLGVAMLAVIDGSVVALNIDPYFADLVKGAVLIAAVSADQLAQVQRERRQKAMAMREQARLEEQHQREEERTTAGIHGDISMPPTGS